MIEFDWLLVKLAENGANHSFVKLSTIALSKLCNMSQQNISKRLIKLEKEGKILRGTNGIKLTERGRGELFDLYTLLKNIFNSGKVKINGKIIEGSKQGGYYLSFPHYKNKIKEKFGFIPYEGTINVKIDEVDLPKRELILREDMEIIPGFSDDKRNYGEIFAREGKLNRHKVVFIFPIRTHHPNTIIEIISSKKLKLNRKNVILEI